MSAANPPGRELMAKGAEAMARFFDQARALGEVATRQAAALAPVMRPQLSTDKHPSAAFMGRNPMTLAQDAMAYAVDATQRSVLFWDTMRKAGNAFVEHERAGCPPVLVFDWEMIVDGRTLPRRCNYALVHIKPPEGFPAGAATPSIS
jgi:hypothetical protein